jgi:hypothetical protein
MLFLLFLHDDRRIRIHTSDEWIRIREAQKHVDPDPEHWEKVLLNWWVYIYQSLFKIRKTKNDDKKGGGGILIFAYVLRRKYCLIGRIHIYQSLFKVGRTKTLVQVSLQYFKYGTPKSSHILFLLISGLQETFLLITEFSQFQNSDPH